MPTRGYPQYYDQVEGEVEELVDTATIKDIYRKIANLGGGSALSYIPNGIDDTDAVRALFAQGAANNGPVDIVINGPVHALWLKPGMELDTTGFSPNSSIRFKGLTLRRWNPADPDGTLGGWITGTGSAANPLAPSLDISWETIDYYPKPLWEGFVDNVNTDPNTGYFEVRMKPGFEPQFTTMRVFHGIDANGIWFASQSEERASAPGISYPVKLQPSGLYRVSPTSDTIAVTGFSSLNPLTVMGTGMDSERTFLASGFVGAGAGNINGHTYTFDLEQGSVTRGVLLENGVEVDAGGWGAITAYGVLTSPRIPTWVVPGLEMIGVCRKHGTPELEPKYSKGWTIGGGQIKAATAVFLGGAFSEDTTVTNLDFRGEGRMASTGGGIVLVEPRGLLRVDNMYVSGIGDDAINQTPRFWNASILSYTSTTITINAASRIWAPRVGDMVLFISPTKARTKATITAVDASVLTSTVVTVSVPGSFDPLTWTVRNDSVKIKGRGGTYYGEGNSRHFFPQTDDFIFESVSTSNTRGSSERAQDPKSGAHSTSGAFGGGISVQNGKITRGCMTYVSRDTCAIFVYRIQGSITPSGLPPVTLGSRTVDGYGFMVGAFEGVDVIFDRLTLLNPGLVRSATPALVSDPTLPGNFDFTVVAQTTTISWLNPDALLWLKIKSLYGGNVIIGNRGQGLLSITVDASAAIRTLAYGTTIISANLTTARNFTLDQTGAQPGDKHVVSYTGTGGSAVVKNGASTIATLTAGQIATFVNDGAAWSKLQ